MWRHRPILEYWCDGYGGLEWIQEIPNGYGGGETRFHIRTPRQVRSAARKARLK